MRRVNDSYRQLSLTTVTTVASPQLSRRTVPESHASVTTVDNCACLTLVLTNNCEAEREQSLKLHLFRACIGPKSWLSGTSRLFQAHGRRQ